MVDDKLYVIGGAVYQPNLTGNLGDAINTVHVFDLKTRGWARAAPLLTPRAYLAVCCEYSSGFPPVREIKEKQGVFSFNQEKNQIRENVFKQISKIFSRVWYLPCTLLGHIIEPELEGKVLLRNSILR